MFHFIHLSINSLLRKVKKLQIITESTNDAIIGIFESKLDESVLKLEIQIHNYKILWCDRNRYRGGLTCYIKHDLMSYNIIAVLPGEIESVFFEILSPNSKPITVEIIFRPPNQSNFLEELNEKMNKINSHPNLYSWQLQH